MRIVDSVGVAGDQGAQGAAGADRPELAVVAHEHQLRPGGFDMGGQAEQVGVVGHPHLVQNDHGPLVELRCGRSSRHTRLANVRDSSMDASWPRVRAA